MKICISGGLPYITVVLVYFGKEINLSNVILDTGSAGTVFSIDRLAPIGVLPDPGDPICRITGVGGSEFVFTKKIDRLVVGNLWVENFNIEIGAMDYGPDFDGIIGTDFLLQTKATIDFGRLEIREVE